MPGTGQAGGACAARSGTVGSMGSQTARTQPLAGSDADGSVGYVALTGPLSGPLTVLYSLRTPVAKLHLDPACPGLGSTPEDVRATRRYRSALQAGLCTWSTACRMCCLEAVLTTALQPDLELAVRPRRRRLAFTASAQPMARRDLDGDDRACARVLEVSASAAERLRRIAANSGLQVTETATGPVVYGVRGSAAVRALARNLRTFVLEVPDDSLSASAVETFWTLVNDDAPELREGGDVGLLWDSAVHLSR